MKKFLIIAMPIVILGILGTILAFWGGIIIATANAEEAHRQKILEERRQKILTIQKHRDYDFRLGVMSAIKELHRGEKVSDSSLKFIEENWRLEE